VSGVLGDRVWLERQRARWWAKSARKFDPVEAVRAGVLVALRSEEPYRLVIQDRDGRLTEQALSVMEAHQALARLAAVDPWAREIIRLRDEEWLTWSEVKQKLPLRREEATLRAYWRRGWEQVAAWILAGG